MSKHIYGCIPTPSAKKARYRVFDAPHFTLPQDLDMRNLQPPVVDQGSLGCHDDKTEVLTESGWKPWNAYDGHDSLATVNPLTHAFEYQHPTALFRYVYEGPMYFADHRSLDCAVTPNHRMYIRPRKSAGFGFETADSIPSIAGLLAAPRGWTGIDLRGLRIGKYELSGDDLISLAALVISDGWISDSEAKENRVGGFCCFNDGRYNIIASLAQRLGIYESAPRKWTFFSAELANWFRESCGCNGRSASAKRVPGIIRFASQRQIKLFLSFFGDQTHTGKRPHQFFSTSDGMIDDLQELLLKCGNRSSIYRAELRAPAVRNDGVPIVSRSSERYLTQWETDHLNLKPRETFKPDYYKGEVFCASVPNSILITRRSGSILISGNSCTANGTCEELEAQALAQGEPLTMRSRLFVYYCSRVIEGTVPQDAGATIPDGIAAVQTQGACSETEWPYDISQFAVQPPDKCYADALQFLALGAQSVNQDLTDLKTALAYGNSTTSLARAVRTDPAHGLVIGILVYDSFESDAVAASGDVPMPGASENQLGGHCVRLVGYTDNGLADIPPQSFIMQNSWGTAWGKRGYASIPYAYILDANLCTDVWLISQVS